MARGSKARKSWLRIRLPFRREPALLLWGLALGASYWLLEAFMDSFVFRQGAFLTRLLKPDLLELWMRCSVLLLILVSWVFLHQLFLERRQSEEKSREALAEKDLLLREIHHRVKNNLQIVSTLLDLQSRLAMDERDRRLFKEGQSRIRAMALIHEKLYGGPKLSEVDLASYVKALAGQLREVYGLEGRGIRLEVEADAISMPLDKAMPCGLIIHELVSNAFKHAFPDKRAGSLRVEVRALPDGSVRLAVNDDGVGMPEDFDTAEPKSLGLHLVRTLGRQLRARVERGDGPGTRVAVTFQL